MENDPMGEWIRLEPKARLRGSPNRAPKFPLPHSSLSRHHYLLPGESKTDYFSLLADLAIEFPPVDMVTSLMIERLGQQIWALRRYATWVRQNHTSLPGDGPRSLLDTQGFGILERMEKASLRTIKELMRMKKDQAPGPKSKQPKPALTPQMVLQKYSHQIGIREWWRNLDESFLDQVERRVSPDDRK
jgi:hypothetical protein